MKSIQSVVIFLILVFFILWVVNLVYISFAKKSLTETKDVDRMRQQLFIVSAISWTLFILYLSLFVIMHFAKVSFELKHIIFVSVFLMLMVMIHANTATKNCVSNSQCNFMLTEQGINRLLLSMVFVVVITLIFLFMMIFKQKNWTRTILDNFNISTRE
jgi:hypothetical protein